jgi:hypothetical protein
MSASGGPDLVTNGLVLCLDAANKKSYSGSGTIWRDLCNNYDFTIVNSPTFGLHKGTPCFSLNQANDYIWYNGSLKHQIASECTLQIVMASISNTNFGSCSRLMVMGDSSGSTDYQFYYCLASCDQTRFGLWYNSSAGGFGDFYPTSSLQSANDDYKIIHVSWKASGRVKYYVNSIEENDRAMGTVFNNSNVNRIVFGANNSFGENSFVRIAYAGMYQRQLSQLEILQNYNALKGRFLLT